MEVGLLVDGHEDVALRRAWRLQLGQPRREPAKGEEGDDVVPEVESNVFVGVVVADHPLVTRALCVCLKRTTTGGSLDGGGPDAATGAAPAMCGSCLPRTNRLTRSLVASDRMIALGPPGVGSQIAPMGASFTSRSALSSAIVIARSSTYVSYNRLRGDRSVPSGRPAGRGPPWTSLRHTRRRSGTPSAVYRRTDGGGLREDRRAGRQCRRAASASATSSRTSTRAAMAGYPDATTAMTSSSTASVVI